MSVFMTRIVGNCALRTQLGTNILAGKLPHAVIIEGPRGTGKHTIAMNIAASLACSHGKEVGSLPCYDCPECRKIFAHHSPDIITVGCEGKATFGVESVRHLKIDVHIVPNDLDFKLYIIEDADKMTIQAQNAFLLTLEEPPPFVHFVLLCENSNLLLDTIKSRAPILRTERISTEEIDSFLCENDRRAAQMKLTSPAEYAELLMASNHGIGTALEYLDPKAFLPIKEMRAAAYDFCDIATSDAGAGNAVQLIRKCSQKRDALSEQLNLFARAVGDLIMLKKAENAPLEFFSDKEKCFEMCDRVSIKALYDLNLAILTAIESIQRNANVRLTLIKLLSDANII